MKTIFLTTILFGLMVNLNVLGQPVRIPWPEITDSSQFIDTRSRPVTLQEKLTTYFKKTGIWLSNDFTGSRLNSILELNDTLFLATIAPENTPVNMSPWYAFRIWTEKQKTIYIKLIYKNGMYRYIPRLSLDGIHWTQIADSNWSINAADSSALMKLTLDQEGLWVAAQELITSKDTYRWVDRLSEMPYIKNDIIGYSHQGKPIMAMTISNTTRKNTLVILSRQHPPEIPGYLEMVSFVETLAGNGRQAKKFRKHFRTIVVPLMNPDGVDNGHWRHNLGGIDLNRDWRFFNQPETMAFREYLLSEVDSGDVKFGIDFHSTQVDLFYIQKEENLIAGKRLALEWLEAINASFPGHSFSPEPTGMTAQISKNWFLHELGAESVTYEVGDNTPRDVISKRGAAAAYILMKMLLKNK